MSATLPRLGSSRDLANTTPALSCGAGVVLLTHTSSHAIIVGMATTHTEQVISQTAGTVYVVRADVPDAEGLATFDCTCPAYNFRSSTVATVAYCKHTAALAKVLGLVPGLGSKTWQRPAVVSA